MLASPQSKDNPSSDNVDLSQTVSLLERYLKQLSLENFSGSATKRIGTTLLVNALDPIFQGKPLLLPLKWASTSITAWLSKKIGKNLAADNEPRSVKSIPGPSQEVDMAMSVLHDFAVVDPKKPVSKNIIKTLVVTLSDQVNAYIRETTPQEVATGVFATIGSVAVGTTFVFFSGPLGWIGIPALWLSEGGAKSFAAFLGKQWSEESLGPKANLPLYYQLLHWQNRKQLQAPKNELTDEELIEQFEFITLEDKPSKPEESSQFLDGVQQIVLIENYIPSASNRR
jgi:hypothetical protein